MKLINDFIKHLSNTIGDDGLMAIKDDFMRIAKTVELKPLDSCQTGQNTFSITYDTKSHAQEVYNALKGSDIIDEAHFLSFEAKYRHRKNQ